MICQLFVSSYVYSLTVRPLFSFAWMPSPSQHVCSSALFTISLTAIVASYLAPNSDKIMQSWAGVFWSYEITINLLFTKVFCNNVKKVRYRIIVYSKIDLLLSWWSDSNSHCYTRVHLLDQVTASKFSWSALDLRSYHPFSESVRLV